MAAEHAPCFTLARRAPGRSLESDGLCRPRPLPPSPAPGSGSLEAAPLCTGGGGAGRGARCQLAAQLAAAQQAADGVAAHAGSPHAGPGPARASQACRQAALPGCPRWPKLGWWRVGEVYMPKCVTTIGSSAMPVRWHVPRSAGTHCAGDGKRRQQELRQEHMDSHACIRNAACMRMHSAHMRRASTHVKVVPPAGAVPEGEGVLDVVQQQRGVVLPRENIACKPGLHGATVLRKPCSTWAWPAVRG